MDILFKPEILGFLNLLHRSPRYLGIADLKKEYAEHLPNMRTIYRWQKELGDKFRYFPRIHFQALGLVHLHLLIEKPSDKWVLFPFAVEIAWLIKDMNERVLYLHCLVPEIYMDTFQNLLMDLKNEGFCKDLKTIQTGDGTQTLKDLKSCFDRKGRIEIDELEENDSGWDLVIGSRYGQDLLKQCPLIIPVVFENYGRKMSLPELWAVIQKRLQDTVWDYLPNHRRKLIHNGKRYVRRAFEFMNEQSLFRQNVIRYRPMLNRALRVFMIARGSSYKEIRSVCPTMDLFQGEEGLTIIRFTGDTALIYKLIESLDRSPDERMEFYLLDKERTWGTKPGARFAYEILFDPRERRWVFPKKKILKLFTRGDKDSSS